jgi:hypothetical protein
MCTINHEQFFTLFFQFTNLNVGPVDTHGQFERHCREEKNLFSFLNLLSVIYLCTWVKNPGGNRKEMPKYTAAEDEEPCCNCNGRCEVHMLQLQRAKIYCMVWMAELIRAIHMQGALYRP